MGRWNDLSQNMLLVVGDGVNDASRSDAFHIDTSGNTTVHNKLFIDGINQQNILRSEFSSSNPGPGTQTGYYLIATVDNLKTINPNKPNMAELLTQAVFSFFTRVNIEDNGYNATNKYQLNASFTIGINQKYQTGTQDKECFYNTHYCLSQSTTPFKSLHVTRNSETNKYDLFVYYETYSALNKEIELTIVMKPGNENENPVVANTAGTRRLTII